MIKYILIKSPLPINISFVSLTVSIVFLIPGFARATDNYTNDRFKSKRSMTKTSELSCPIQRYICDENNRHITFTDQYLDEMIEAEQTIEIFSEDQLVNIKSLFDFQTGNLFSGSSGNYVLCNSIELSNSSNNVNTPYIRHFRGDLDGNYYTISNLKKPLFQDITSGGIRNLRAYIPFKNITLADHISSNDQSLIRYGNLVNKISLIFPDEGAGDTNDHRYLKNIDVYSEGVSLSPSSFLDQSLHLFYGGVTGWAFATTIDNVSFTGDFTSYHSPTYDVGLLTIGGLVGGAGFLTHMNRVQVVSNIEDFSLVTNERISGIFTLPFGNNVILENSKFVGSITRASTINDTIAFDDPMSFLVFPLNFGQTITHSYANATGTIIRTQEEVSVNHYDYGLDSEFDINPIPDLRFCGNPTTPIPEKDPVDPVHF